MLSVDYRRARRSATAPPIESRPRSALNGSGLAVRGSSLACPAVPAVEGLAASWLTVDEALGSAGGVSVSGFRVSSAGATVSSAGFGVVTAPETAPLRFSAVRSGVPSRFHSVIWPSGEVELTVVPELATSPSIERTFWPVRFAILIAWSFG
jgi:hypothetical protein